MNAIRAHRRTRLAALATALLLTAGAAGSAAAAADNDSSGHRREAAALTGTAKLYRPAGDDITFTVDAHLAAKDNMDPRKATGTFHFSHYTGTWGASADVKVDCLVTGGNVAVVTGIVTRADGVAAPAVGKRVGVTVHDLGRHDRLGYSWAAVGVPGEGEPLPCTSSAPFEKVKAGSGDWKVLPWIPEYPQSNE
ncbi:Repetin [Streptomyces sp. NPDC093225]|uniref:Repetin n=1 Tax=Streptomyces sp. NPDC093225 TaxID=3366034 RepID=UPI00382039C3